MPCPSAAQNTGAKICRHIPCRQTDSLANQQAVLADGTAAHLGNKFVDSAPCGPACLSVLNGCLPSGARARPRPGGFSRFIILFSNPRLPPQKKKNAERADSEPCGSKSEQGGEWICRKIRTLEAESLADESFPPKKKKKKTWFS